MTDSGGVIQRYQDGNEQEGADSFSGTAHLMKETVPSVTASQSLFSSSEPFHSNRNEPQTENLNHGLLAHHRWLTTCIRLWG
jgi:hypothetical protein